MLGMAKAGFRREISIPIKDIYIRDISAGGTSGAWEELAGAEGGRLGGAGASFFLSSSFFSFFFLSL